jgi:hypothetical protein
MNEIDEVRQKQYEYYLKELDLEMNSANSINIE